MRLTYANVVSTLALFLVLTGGAAYAAHRYLTKKSVGTPQLKANAVTTSKIKANAITTRKIKKIAVSSEKLKEDAVTTEKLADKAVTGGKIDLDTVPFSRVVHRAGSGATVPLKSGELVLYPLESPGYTQKPHESDSFLGALDVSFAATCKGDRSIDGIVLLDEPDPLHPKGVFNVVAQGKVEEKAASGGAARRVELNSVGVETPTRFEPGSPKPHTLSLIAESHCETGSGVTGTFGGVDVIGVE
jgi:methionine-rich copper-binding protein CopC